MAESNPFLEGTEAMMKSWSDAQKLMWDSFADMARLSSTPNGATANPFAGAAEEWQRLTQANLNVWQGKDPFADNLVSQLLSSQSAVLKMLEHTAEAWQALAPKLNQNGDWQSTLSDYSKTLQEQMMRTPFTMMETVTESGDLWAAYLKEWQKLMPLGMGAADFKPQTGVTTDSTVMQLMDRFWNSFDSTLGRAITAPTLGYSREFNAKLLNGFDAWTKLRRAEAAYGALIAQLWSEAFEATMTKLVERGMQGEMPGGAKELINLWISTADEVFVNEFGTDAYIKTQGDLLNATMTYQIKERAILEAFLDAYGLPTRTELDETHQTIHELRRELRTLKRERKVENKSGPSETDTAIEALKEEVAALRHELSEKQTPQNNLEANLPLEAYSTLSVAEVTAQLGELAPYELEQVRAFELLHKARKTLLQDLDSRLAKGA